VVDLELVERESFDDLHEKIDNVGEEPGGQLQRNLQCEYVGILSDSDTPSPILLANPEAMPQKPSYRAEKTKGGQRVQD